MVRVKPISAAICAVLVVAAGNCLAVENHTTVLQGGVARWSSQAATECGIFGRRYAALDGICYYPVDMKAKPGVHEIAMWDATGSRTLGTLTVTRRACAQTEIALNDDTYLKIGEANQKRGTEERDRIVKAVSGTDAKPGFALPLMTPAVGATTKDRSDFCELRLYNGGAVKSRHTGLDYPLAQGTPVMAGADGTVALAEDQFYTGKTVVVDHGGGLVTMLFHLDEVAVKTGAMVKRGDKLGTVGSTGRSTGPHLHFGARYQNQRIDAGTLLGDPTQLPGVGEAIVVAVGDTAGLIGAASSGQEDSAGGEVTAEEFTSPDSSAAAGAASAAAAQAASEVGDPESADAAERKEDALEAEAEAQRKADEAAKSR